jgi:hypothetical protein
MLCNTDRYLQLSCVDLDVVAFARTTTPDTGSPFDTTSTGLAE